MYICIHIYIHTHTYIYIYIVLDEERISTRVLNIEK